jgi:hypothetical protein
MRAALLLLACVVATAYAEPSKRFGDHACLTQSGAAGMQACEKLANDVSHDIGAVRALGDELERSGRFEEAATAYRVALGVHPENRDLMQRMIRARGQARGLRLLAPASAAANCAGCERDGRVAPGFGAKSGALNGQATGAQVAGAQAASAQATSAQAFGTQVSGAQVSGAQGSGARAALTGSAAPAPIAGAPSAIAPAPSTAALPAAASKAAAPDGRYLALIIGNERYASFTPLRTPAADAQAIATVLRKDYGFSVTVLNDATRYQIVSALSTLRREATENDSVLIYYAGHGYLDDTTSRGYWLPIDAERDSIANWLSTSDITDVLAGLQARHALILADSCFSGTLLRSDPAVAIDERQSLLKKLATLRSRTIMTSGGLEPVGDGGADQHSIFAAALLRALHDNRNALEAGRLFMQIRDRVALNAAQTPQYGPLRNAGHDGGDFIFTRR